MENLRYQMSVKSKGLRHKMAISFGVFSIALLVLLGYLFPGVSSIFNQTTNLKLILGIVFIIVLVGFAIIAQIVEPIIKISREAKRISEGDLGRKIPFAGDDEIGQLSTALNKMTLRIKDNLEELNRFGEKTEMINAQINRHILTLSSLLQVSNLISQNAPFAEVVGMAVEKCLSSAEISLVCLVLKDDQSGDFSIKTIRGVRVKNILGAENFIVRLGEGLLGKAILKQEATIIDKTTKASSAVEDFKKMFLVNNAAIVPLLTGEKTHGLLIAGNDKEHFTFQNTNYEFIDLLAKQISIAIENDLLVKRVEKLEIIDSLTGLYNHSFIYQRLDEEIKRAISFQRPCAFILFAIDGFKEFYDSFGHLAAENALIKFASILKENTREVDKAARFGDHEFAIILPERNKRQAIEVAESVRLKIEFIFSEEEDVLKKMTCTGAVTENPVDGITAKDLIEKAKTILESAKKQGKNRICYKV